MNKESNTYTFSFAIIMVLIIAIVLSGISELLYDKKEQNKRDKKMIDILSAINIDATRANADSLYDQYIYSSSIIDYQGNILEGDAFDIDVLTQYRDKTLSSKQKKYPLFHAKKNSSEYIIVPMVGSGLWGPIWGFVAFENDYQTIYGAAFDHKTETPGLGAEINTDFFEKPFEGKKIINKNDEFVSIIVQKGGADKDDPHAVDGITGGTITSDGVTDMLKNTLSIYNNYFLFLIQEKNNTKLESVIRGQPLRAGSCYCTTCDTTIYPCEKKEYACCIACGGSEDECEEYKNNKILK